MTTFSRTWCKKIENEIVTSIRNAPHPKGTGKLPEKIDRKKLFPKFKPGTGGFDLFKKDSNTNTSSDNS